MSFARQLVTRALQACPKSGRIWSLHAQMSDKNSKNQIVIDSIVNCEHDPYAIMAVCRLFWSQNRPKKVDEWFEKGVKIDSDCGDMWALFYLFIKTEFNESEERLNKLLETCEKADPRHGDIWCSVTKDVKNWQNSIRENLELASKLIRKEL